MQEATSPPYCHCLVIPCRRHSALLSCTSETHGQTSSSSWLDSCRCLLCRPLVQRVASFWDGLSSREALGSHSKTAHNGKVQPILPVLFAPTFGVQESLHVEQKTLQRRKSRCAANLVVSRRMTLPRLPINHADEFSVSQSIMYRDSFAIVILLLKCINSLRHTQSFCHSWIVWNVSTIHPGIYSF